MGDFKKDMSRRERQEEWRYKEDAICQVGKLFASIIKEIDLTGVVFVPIPPSKVRGDPNYDPRLIQALKKASRISGVNLPISECISQKHSTEPEHKSGERKLPVEHAKNYDVKGIPSDTKRVIIVDDVLTTGGHFKGAEIALKKHRPQIRVVGLFIARTVHPNLSREAEEEIIIEMLGKKAGRDAIRQRQMREKTYFEDFSIEDMLDKPSGVQ